MVEPSPSNNTLKLRDGVDMPVVAVGVGTQWFRRPEHDNDEGARVARIQALQAMLLGEPGVAAKLSPQPLLHC